MVVCKGIIGIKISQLLCCVQITYWVWWRNYSLTMHIFWAIRPSANTIKAQMPSACREGSVGGFSNQPLAQLPEGGTPGFLRAVPGWLRLQLPPGHCWLLDVLLGAASVPALLAHLPSICLPPEWWGPHWGHLSSWVMTPRWHIAFTFPVPPRLFLQFGSLKGKRC